MRPIRERIYVSLVSYEIMYIELSAGKVIRDSHTVYTIHNTPCVTEVSSKSGRLHLTKIFYMSTGPHLRVVTCKMNLSYVTTGPL